MDWLEKFDVLVEGLNESVNLLNNYCNRPKFFFEPHVIDCRLLSKFLHESRLQVWRFIKWTLNADPKFYEPNWLNNGEFTIPSTVYLALRLKSSILEVKGHLINDPETDIFNNLKMVELFTMLIKFLPEMRKVVKVYNNSGRYDHLETKAEDKKRKRALTEHIKTSMKNAKTRKTE